MFEMFFEKWEEAFADKCWWVWFTLPAYILVVLITWIIQVCRTKW